MKSWHERTKVGFHRSSSICTTYPLSHCPQPFPPPREVALPAADFFSSIFIDWVSARGSNLVRFPAPGAAITGFPAFIPFDIGMRVGVGRWDDPSCPDCKRKQTNTETQRRWSWVSPWMCSPWTRAGLLPQMTPPQAKLSLGTWSQYLIHFDCLLFSPEVSMPKFLLFSSPYPTSSTLTEDDLASYFTEKIQAWRTLRQFYSYCPPKLPPLSSICRPTLYPLS